MDLHRRALTRNVYIGRMKPNTVSVRTKSDLVRRINYHLDWDNARHLGYERLYVRWQGPKKEPKPYVPCDRPMSQSPGVQLSIL